MMKYIGIYSLFFLFSTAILFGQKNEKPLTTEVSKSDIVVWNVKRLAESKARLATKDPDLLPAYEQLIKLADDALRFKPVSVMDKKDLPPSGDKHDYMSIGPYWWPDSSKADGLPYIRKDGEINPEVRNYLDKENLPRLCEHVFNLSLAYYFSNNEEYAKHASKLIKVWFLDTATAMKPNLEFGQAIKGITTGRAEGIIEVRHFIYLLEGVQLLRSSESFKEGKEKKLKKWMSDFLAWMQHSKIGLDELNAPNNHGVWYDATSLALANFTGDTALAAKIIHRAAERLDKEMDDKGYFPFELARTTSLHYSTFILDAFTIIAQLSEKINIDFWNLKTQSGKSLKMGYDALLPHYAGSKAWTWKQIKPFNYSNSHQILWKASQKYNCTSCIGIIKKNASDYNKLVLRLL